MHPNKITIEIEEKIILSGKDIRYKRDGYNFLLASLEYHHSKTDDNSHIPANELVQSVSELAIMKYGPIARAVLAEWGIYKAIDIGIIVYNLIDIDILTNDEEDSLDDFANADELFSTLLPEDSYAVDKKNIKMLKDS